MAVGIIPDSGIYIPTAPPTVFQGIDPVAFLERTKAAIVGFNNLTYKDSEISGYYAQVNMTMTDMTFWNSLTRNEKDQILFNAARPIEIIAHEVKIPEDTISFIAIETNIFSPDGIKIATRGTFGDQGVW